MADLFGIFTRIVLPILLIAAAGYLLERKFRFEPQVLSKFLFFIITPCLIFTRVYSTAVSWQMYGKFALFTVSVMAVMGMVGLLFARLRGFTPSMRSAFMLVAMMCNSGNYGLPVVELAFKGNPYASSIQLLVMITQGIIHFTFGIFILSRGRYSFAESVKRIFQYPILYAVVIAFAFKGFNIPVWQPVWETMEKIALAFVPVALFTLGAQLGRIRLAHGIADVLAASVFRLLLGPCIAFGMILAFGFQGTAAQTLFIGASMPTAVNSALLAVELKNEPTFASQTVFYSTLLSFFTVSLAIWIARMWIG